MASALRVGRLLRSGGRSCWLLPRAYSNGSNTLPLTFGTPSEVFYNAVQVKQVDVSSTTGHFGILPNHVPAIAVLKPGLVTVYEEGKTMKYFASSGTVSINADSTVQVLAEEAFRLDQLDVQVARSEMDKCQQKLAQASSEEERAEANIGIEFYDALVKALDGGQ